MAAFLLFLFVIYSFFRSDFYHHNLYWIITNNNCSIKSAIKLCVHGFRYHLKLGVGAQLLPANKVITQRDLCEGLTRLYALTGIGLVSLLVVQLFEHTPTLGTHCWYPLNCGTLKHCCDLSDQCASLPLCWEFLSAANATVGHYSQLTAKCLSPAQRDSAERFWQARSHSISTTNSIGRHLPHSCDKQRRTLLPKSDL